MENDFSGIDPPGRPVVPTSAEARDVLSLLDVDGSRLAERVVTPWWYHVALGAIVALFVASQAMPTAAMSVAIVLGIVALPVLTTVYSRRYGVSVSQPAGPRGRRLLLMTLGVLVAAMLSGVALKLAGIALSWVMVPAVLAFIVTVVLGRRYDDALRREIAARTHARS
ncbi:hypothetical protein [Mycetocola zhujimingii]|uniref:hypothetical protein n=1 Tax=Mycetocola zhujimingii TaxID=2079792 RepID=UPI0013C4CCF5|nr:hypothetical protein [Mycetocola zhujimingii]